MDAISSMVDLVGSSVASYDTVLKTTFSTDTNYKAKMQELLNQGFSKNDSIYRNQSLQRDAKLASTYGNNYMAAINDPANSAIIDDLKRLRDMKIANNPEQYANYSFNIANMTVREESDIKKVAKELFDLQRKSSRVLGGVAY